MAVICFGFFFVLFFPVELFLIFIVSKVSFLCSAVQEEVILRARLSEAALAEPQSGLQSSAEAWRQVKSVTHLVDNI